MGPIWVLSAPDGPHVGPMNLAIRVAVSRWQGSVRWPSPMRWPAATSRCWYVSGSPGYSSPITSSLERAPSSLRISLCPPSPWCFRDWCLFMCSFSPPSGLIQPWLWYSSCFTSDASLPRYTFSGERMMTIVSRIWYDCDMHELHRSLSEWEVERTTTNGTNGLSTSLPLSSVVCLMVVMRMYVT